MGLLAFRRHPELHLLHLRDVRLRADLQVITDVAALSRLQLGILIFQMRHSGEEVKDIPNGKRLQELFHCKTSL